MFKDTGLLPGDFELQQGGKALRLCVKTWETEPECFDCRYNVGKNGEQWHPFGQLLPVFERICHEDSGSCCLVSNCFSKKIHIFFLKSKNISTEENAQKSHKFISREINKGEKLSVLQGLSIWGCTHICPWSVQPCWQGHPLWCYSQITEHGIAGWGVLNALRALPIPGHAKRD